MQTVKMGTTMKNKSSSFFSSPQTTASTRSLKIPLEILYAPTKGSIQKHGPALIQQQQQTDFYSLFLWQKACWLWATYQHPTSSPSSGGLPPLEQSSGDSGALSLLGLTGQSLDWVCFCVREINPVLSFPLIPLWTWIPVNKMQERQILHYWHINCHPKVN